MVDDLVSKMEKKHVQEKLTGLKQKSLEDLCNLSSVIDQVSCESFYMIKTDNYYFYISLCTVPFS